MASPLDFTIRVVVGSLAVSAALVGCSSHRDLAPRAEHAVRTTQPSFTGSLHDDGCNGRVAPITLHPLRHPKQFERGSGPATQTVRITDSSRALPRYPTFPSALGGLPFQGRARSESLIGAFYDERAVDGRSFDDVISGGGVAVSASHGVRHPAKFLSRLPALLTRVRIGGSPGWINRAWQPESHTVSWFAAGGVFMGVRARRSPARLVELARSLVC